MASTTRSTTEAPESFQSGLQSLIPQIANVMGAPDATLRFCQQLLLAVAGKIRQHGQAKGAPAGVGGAVGGGGPGAGLPGQPGSTPPAIHPPGLQMPGATAGGGAANPSMPSLAAPNLMQGSPTPTPDELRRIISANSAGV